LGVADGPVVAIEGARVWTPEGAELLRGVSWTVRPGEHWALLGPNGAGKSTLLALAGATRHPSEGSVDVLGGRLGRVDVRALRERIGVVDAVGKLPDWLAVGDAVLTGATATVWPLWHRYGPAERARAAALLALVGCAELAEREVGTLSQGERQRLRVARALMTEPPLLLLDEPATGLDLPAREALLAALASLAASRPELASVVVAHHLEDLPASTSHALLLRRGEVVAAGGAGEVLTDEAVSACFGLAVRVRREEGRWSARAVPTWGARGSGTGG
jgi:iron complex transport system ATP-binding protein